MKRTTQVRVVLGVLALGGWMAAAAQGDPLDTVAGRVVDAGAPVSGAAVELVNSCKLMGGLADVRLKVTTGADGKFLFSKVEPGGCFTVRVLGAKGGVVAQTAQFEMASYNHHMVKPDLDVSQAAPEDKFLWLEEVNGAKAMDWVKAEDARSEKVLEGDSHYAAYYAAALKAAEDPSRLAEPELRGHEVYNFWQDAEHQRGILRKTTVDDYLTKEPHWQTVIDVDALGKKDGVKWVFKGANCLYPGDQYCLVTLSAGGEDADSLREFDLKTGTFVEGGFKLDRSKQRVEWADKDTLLLGRDWGAGTMTSSGYPYVVKEWKRGTPLSTAKEVYRGEATDMQVQPEVLHDAQGHVLVSIYRGVTFFEGQTWVRTPAGLKQLDLPKKSNLAGMLDGRVLFEIREDWTPAGSGRSFTQGSLLEVKLADLLKDPEHLKPRVVFEPTKVEFLQGEATTHDRLLVTTLNKVQGEAYVYTSTAAGWTKKALAVPAKMSLGIVAANDSDNKFFLSVSGFLTPPSLWMGDAGTGAVSQAKAQPAMFDASKDEVEQMEATSKDGTAVPYFVVHPKGMKLDGSNPTLLNAYGGFEIAETPHYSVNTGRLWLEQGGVFVLANIRGGGEFGPAWHEAGLTVHRQRIYDDFAAVGEDLVKRKITSPEKLGIMGGSNGGLLMGVEMEQHPQLWKAVVIQVPLLDMIRFEKIEAGASWVGEYGSVSDPAQRAFLASISPYQNLRADVTYPEPLIFTTTKDDRVGPEHARKFAALMEANHMPFLYDEIIEGGHAAGADLKQTAKTWALTYTYLTRKLME
ncbi:MAG: prolyl oligopeptidase family serine peptidase [Acidobacteriota bacterium]